MKQHPVLAENAKVGDIVYPYGSPQSAGVVVEVTGNHWSGHLHIKKLSGKPQKIERIGARYLQALVEEHEHKAKRHAETLKKLKEMK